MIAHYEAVHNLIPSEEAKKDAGGLPWLCGWGCGASFASRQQRARHITVVHATPEKKKRKAEQNLNALAGGAEPSR